MAYIRDWIIMLERWFFLGLIVSALLSDLTLSQTTNGNFPFDPECADPVTPVTCALRGRVQRSMFDNEALQCVDRLMCPEQIQNSFPNISACAKSCHCSQPLDPGRVCRIQNRPFLILDQISQLGSSVAWYYSKEGGCQRFFYQGCGGNNNRFSTREECMDTCADDLTGFGGLLINLFNADNRPAQPGISINLGP